MGEASDAEYEAITAKLKEEGENASAESEARKTKVEAEIAANDEAIAAAKSAQETADEDAAKARKALADEHAAINQKFEDDNAALKEKFDADEKSFSDEKAASDAKFAGEFKTAAEKAAAEKAEIEEEAKENAATAAAEKKAIEDDYAAKQEAADAEEAAYQKLKAEQEEAEHNKRAEWQAAHKAEMEKDEEDYEAAMHVAAEKQHDADVAQKAYETAEENSVESQEEADDAFKNEMSADGEIKECATDGSECQNEDGTCHNMEEEHLFMDCNGYSCTDSHKTDADCNSNGNWADVEAPLPKTERRPMTQGCADAMAALESADGGKFAGAVALMKTPAADWHQSPLEVIGCAEGATRAEMKNGLNLFLAAAEICPEYCIPGTDTETTGHENTDESTYSVSDTNGICVPDGSYTQLKENLNDIPVYKNTGTGGRFEAGISTTMCTWATSIVKGWFAGAQSDAR